MNKNIAFQQMEDLAPTVPVPDLLTADNQCCYILLSLINSARAKITDYPSVFAEGYTQELALKQLDDCEKWVTGKLSEP